MIDRLKNKLNTYLEDEMLSGYIVDENRLCEIFENISTYEKDINRSITVSIMYYLISEAFRFHDSITDDKRDISKDVILGDYFGILYHKAVIDQEEHKLNEKIISDYKKLCMDTFEERVTTPPYLLYKGEQ